MSVSSVAQSCLTLCDPMNRSTPGLPVHHHLLEFTQIHVHWVRDAIQPSHPRSSPSTAPNPSQHQSFPVSQLFTWGGQSTGASASASFPPKKSQGWSPLEWTGWISLQAKGLSRVFSNTTDQKHQFIGAQPSSHYRQGIIIVAYCFPNWLPLLKIFIRSIFSVTLSFKRISLLCVTYIIHISFSLWLVLLSTHLIQLCVLSSLAQGQIHNRCLLYCLSIIGFIID